jgi:hypothetical protein
MTTPSPLEQSKTAPAKATKARVAQRRAPISPSKGKAVHKATGAKKAATTRPGSKTAKILDLLRRPAGASVKELMKATGWQHHSVRSFLSGTVAKKMGTPVESFKRGYGERGYRLSN